ncbi:unnamed protein product, partial [Mesorhabditis spiculigera]
MIGFSGQYHNPEPRTAADAPDVAIVARSMFEVGGRLCSLYCPVTSDPLQNRGLHAFYTARQPESDSELFVGKIVIDLSISARPLGYDALSVPLQASFPVAPEQLKMFYKRDTVTNAPSLELYHPLADDASRFKCAVWDLKQNECKFQKEVAAFEWIEEGGRIWSLKWQETYYMVKKRMVDWMIARPNMDDYVPPHYLHRKNGEFGWLMPKKSNGNPNFFPDKCLTKMAKEAKFEKWTPLLKHHALLYNDHQFQIVRAPAHITEGNMPTMIQKRAPATTFFPPTLMPRTAIHAFRSDDQDFVIAAIGHLVEVVPVDGEQNFMPEKPDAQHLFPVFEQGERIVQIQVVQPAKKSGRKDKTVVLHTDSLKYAYLELDLLLQWIDGCVERPPHKWKTVVDMTKIKGAERLPADNIAQNVVWTHNKGKITLEGPVRLEILNPFTKNGESMVLDGHMGYGLYT